MRQSLSPEDKRRAWLWAALIVLMMLCLAAGSVLLMNRPPMEGVREASATASLRAASAGLDEIRVDAALDPEARTLTFSSELTLRNRTGQEQSQVVLRSWSGAYLSQDTSPAASDELFAACYGSAFDPGGLTITGAQVDGEDVPWQYLDEARTVLSLPAVWPLDGTVTIKLQCTVDIPLCASRFGYAQGVFMLGNVFPVPAVWQNGAWRTDPYAAVGDPFMSECANWTVRLTVPEGYEAAGSALAERTDTGYAFTGLCLRDFALVVSDRFTTAQAMAGNTVVTAMARTKKDANSMLRIAVQAMNSFGSRWGSYAWPSFTLAQSVFPYGGMEYPGLVMIAADVLEAGGSTLEYTVAHETAHQWWSVMVGSDSFRHPWQDEALCEYACLDYMGDVHGASVRESLIFDRIETSLRITVPRGVTPGSPIDYFQDLEEYSVVVYQRGAALWTALETHMGKEALDALLRDYLETYRFRNATREDLEALISRHCRQDMSGLMVDYLDTYMR